jgi:hypothetical protein
LKHKFADEISKHMADLSGEFEDLFDPYLPIASKLKMKMCPSLGVSLTANMKMSINLLLPNFENPFLFSFKDYRIL